MNPEFIDAEKVLSLSEDIFFELAHENLDHEIKNLIQRNKKNLLIEIQETISDWQDVIPYFPDPDCYLEVKIFLKFSGEADVDIAFILIPADFENREMMSDESDTDEKQVFHIRWC